MDKQFCARQMSLWSPCAWTDCLQHLKVLFPTIAMNTTSDGNWIIWASRAQQNAADRTGRDEAKRRCKQLNELLEFNLWQQVKGFYRGS